MQGLSDSLAGKSQLSFEKVNSRWVSPGLVLIDDEFFKLVQSQFPHLSMMVLDELLVWAWLVLDFEKPEWGHPLVEHNYHMPLASFQRLGDHCRVGGSVAACLSVGCHLALTGGGLFSQAIMALQGVQAFLPSVLCWGVDGTVSLMSVLGYVWGLSTWDWLTGWGPGEILWAEMRALILGNLWALGWLWIVGGNSRVSLVPIWLSWSAKVLLGYQGLLTSSEPLAPLTKPLE